MSHKTWGIVCPGPTLAGEWTRKKIREEANIKLVAVNSALAAEGIDFDLWIMQDMEVLIDFVSKHKVPPTVTSGDPRRPALVIPRRFMADIEDHSDYVIRRDVGAFLKMADRIYLSDPSTAEHSPEIPFLPDLGWRSSTMMTALGFAIKHGAHKVNVYGATMRGQGYFQPGLENYKTIHEDERWVKERWMMEAVIKTAGDYGVSVSVEAPRRPVIVSFFTPNYTLYAQTMKKSVERYGFETDIVPINTRGQWIDNMYYRAEFIMYMLKKHRRDVVWMDCDAIMNRYPDIFDDFKSDLGVYYHEWSPSQFYPNGFRELCGGTMYFSYQPAVLGLVNRWMELNNTLPRYPRTQIVLQKAVDQMLRNSPSLKIKELPPEYVFVNRFMLLSDPVITHGQASTEFRRPEEEGFSDVSHYELKDIGEDYGS